MSKTALIILAEGAEEMETVITADVLVRGGVDVTIAGLESAAAVKCSRGVVLSPHCSLSSVQDRAFDCVILPGGLGGAQALAASSAVKETLQRHRQAGRLLAAICAAPIALESHQVDTGALVTSHPSVRDQLKSFKYSEDRVCVHEKLVTSRGPGTAFEFAIRLVEILVGKEKAEALLPPMLLKL